MNAQRAKSRGITTAVAVVGAVVLAGNVAGAAFWGVNSVAGGGQVLTAEVSGVREITLDVASSDLVVRFGDVTEAELRVSGGAARGWKLERDDDELVVSNSRKGSTWFFEGLPFFDDFDLPLFDDDSPSGGWFGAMNDVELVLPAALEEELLDLEVDVNVGTVDVTGDFQKVDLEVGAGEVDIDGTALSVDADVDAGSATVRLADVQTASFSVGAGEMDVVLTGTAPRETTVEVNVGSIDVTLPDEEYDLRTSASLGSITHDLQDRAGAANTVVAKVDVGEIRLRAGE